MQWMYDHQPEDLEDVDLYSTIVLVSTWILVTLSFVCPAYKMFLTQETVELMAEIVATTHAERDLAIRDAKRVVRYVNLCEYASSDEDEGKMSGFEPDQVLNPIG